MKKQRILIFLFVFFIAAGYHLAGSEPPAGEMKTGASRICINPPENLIRKWIKPGYAEPAIIDAFMGLMEEYLMDGNTASSK